MNKWIAKIKTLYLKEKLSGVEVASRLNLNRRYVYRIMEKGGIKRRDPAVSNNIRFLKKSPTFKIKKKLNGDNKSLRDCGVMIYWAEGWKDKRKQMLDFANSDPTMIKIYLKFLRNICGVSENKLRIYLYCYANQDVNKLKKFWSDTAKIPLKQFTKPYVKKDFREDKINKMPHGLIHIRYADKKLYSQIFQWYEKIIKKWAGTEVVKPGTL